MRHSRIRVKASRWGQSSSTEGYSARSGPLNPRDAMGGTDALPSRPFWWDAETCPWACVRHTRPHVLETNSSRSFKRHRHLLLRGFASHGGNGQRRCQRNCRTSAQRVRGELPSRPGIVLRAAKILSSYFHTCPHDVSRGSGQSLCFSSCHALSAAVRLLHRAIRPGKARHQREPFRRARALTI
jgi:hypothetical protein